MESYENLFEELVSYQKAKLLKLAREVIPRIALDDLMQPFDFPELESHPDFRYEEGVLAGILTVQMALQATLSENTCLK